MKQNSSEATQPHTDRHTQDGWLQCHHVSNHSHISLDREQMLVWLLNHNLSSLVKSHRKLCYSRLTAQTLPPISCLFVTATTALSCTETQQSCRTCEDHPLSAPCPSCNLLTFLHHFSTVVSGVVADWILVHIMGPPGWKPEPSGLLRPWGHGWLSCHHRSSWRQWLCPSYTVKPGDVSSAEACPLSTPSGIFVLFPLMFMLLF